MKGSPSMNDVERDPGPYAVHGVGAGIRTSLVRWAPVAVIAIAAVGIWEAVVALEDIPNWKLPAPSAIADALWGDRGDLARHTWVTLKEVLIGFGIALGAGLLLATLIHMSRTMERIIYPPAIASQTLPIIVIAPLLLAWVGYGLQHKVVVVALISFFPILVNTVEGLRSTDGDLLNLMRALGANRWQMFIKAQVPHGLPYMFSGIKIAVTASVIGAVVGEWVGSSEGLGYLALRSKSQFLTERVYAAIFLLGVMGVVLFLAAGLAQRVLVPWHGRQRGGPNT